MARNVEIKARISSVLDVLPKALTLASSAPTEVFQDDTFFKCPNGRLKLRAFDAERGQLIFYQRADDAGPKESFYLITSTTEPNALRDVLDRANGKIGRVVKQRTLILVGRARIHLDRVEGLGDFIELEVVLSEGESAANGIAEARQLMDRLDISADQLVEEAYFDLLRRAASS